MLAIQSQVLVLNKMLSSEANNCITSVPVTNSIIPTTTVSTSVLAIANKSVNSVVTTQMSSVPPTSESLAAPPEKPTLGRLRLVSTPSTSSISPIGSSLDSLEEEPAQDASQHSEQQDFAEAEAVEPGGCVIS